MDRLSREEEERLLGRKSPRSFSVSNRVLIAMEDYCKANGGTPSSLVSELLDDWYDEAYLPWSVFTEEVE